MSAVQEGQLKIKFSPVLLITLCSGCMSFSAPKYNAEFSTTTNVSQLSGTYKNKGEPNGKLDKLIFSGRKLSGTLGSGDIELIQVLVLDNILTVNAIKDDCVIFKQDLIYGEDFELIDGKILIQSKHSIHSRGVGDPLIGPSYDKIELGLDTGGHGKAKHSETGAGLVFFFLPVAYHGVHETRFLRVENDKHYKVCNARK